MAETHRSLSGYQLQFEQRQQPSSNSAASETGHSKLLKSDRRRQKVRLFIHTAVCFTLAGRSRIASRVALFISELLRTLVLRSFLHRTLELSR